jgi:hypothetical protein
MQGEGYMYLVLLEVSGAEGGTQILGSANDRNSLQPGHQNPKVE